MKFTEKKAVLDAVLKEIDGTKRLILEPIVQDLFFLEEKLKELRGYPFIKANPRDPTQQKPTAAAKQYKDLLQQYANCAKLVCSYLNRDDGGEESPLRQYFKKKAEQLGISKK